VTTSSRGKGAGLARLCMSSRRSSPTSAAATHSSSGKSRGCERRCPARERAAAGGHGRSPEWMASTIAGSVDLVELVLEECFRCALRTSEASPTPTAWSVRGSEDGASSSTARRPRRLSASWSTATGWFAGTAAAKPRPSGDPAAPLGQCRLRTGRCPDMGRGHTTAGASTRGQRLGAGSQAQPRRLHGDQRGVRSVGHRRFDGVERPSRR
jgi:hypothetical protein